MLCCWSLDSRWGWWNEKLSFTHLCCSRVKLENSVLIGCICRHLDFFEMLRNEDELLVSKRFDVVSPINGFTLLNWAVSVTCWKADDERLELLSFRSMWRPKVPARCLSRLRRTWSTLKHTLTCSLPCSTASWCPVSTPSLVSDPSIHSLCAVGDSGVCVCADKQSGAVLHYWLLLDRIIQQLVLQTDKGENPDVAPLEDFNVKNIISM